MFLLTTFDHSNPSDFRSKLSRLFNLAGLVKFFRVSQNCFFVVMIEYKIEKKSTSLVPNPLGVNYL